MNQTNRTIKPFLYPLACSVVLRMSRFWTLNVRRQRRTNENLIIMLVILLLASPVIAAEGMIDVPSSFTVEETAMRMKNVLQAKGMTLFNEIKHSESAAQVDIELRDTVVLIFGNPKVGSPLMQCQQSVAIDLPQKALIWIDGKNQVWISYNDPSYLQKRHDIVGCEAVLEKVGQALAGMTKAAAME
jgi:uncharacterized protein (DUF302 family)